MSDVTKEMTMSDVVAAHPELAHRITSAYATVTMCPDRDVSAELHDCDLTEDEIHAIEMEVIKTRYGV